MNLQSWIVDMKAQISVLEQSDDCYNKGENIFLPVADIELLEIIEKQRGIKLPDEFCTFYQTVGGLSLPDVYNAYFIYPLKHVSRTDEFTPTRIVGANECEILTFGGDGGGNIFALQLNEKGDVVCMSNETLIEDSIYYEGHFPIKVVGNTFYSFLERLLADTKASN